MGAANLGGNILGGGNIGQAAGGNVMGMGGGVMGGGQGMGGGMMGAGMGRLNEGNRERRGGEGLMNQNLSLGQHGGSNFVQQQQGGRPMANFGNQQQGERLSGQDFDNRRDGEVRRGEVGGRLQRIIL